MHTSSSLFTEFRVDEQVRSVSSTLRTYKDRLAHLVSLFHDFSQRLARHFVTDSYRDLDGGLTVRLMIFPRGQVDIWSQTHTEIFDD